MMAVGWQKIKTPKAGGPYSIEITIGDSIINYKNVLVGEVCYAPVSQIWKCL